MPIHPSPQFVVKISKYCNLRCGYCYEFPHLGDKARMSLESLDAMFKNIRAGLDDLEISKLEFVWHGGEPLLVPMEFYEEMIERQRQVFGADVECINTLQTNLTVLSERHLDALKRRLFQDVGVSFDVYGDQRIDTKGELRTEAVLANLQKLIDNQIAFGCIAVLARNTLPKVKEIYRFFDDLKIQHRMLAFYRSAGDAQAQAHGLGFDELVHAYRDLFHEWLGSETCTSVEPIEEMVGYAIDRMTEREHPLFDRNVSDRVFIVDVNGDTFNPIESYEPEFCYGNLFRSSLREIASCGARQRSIALAQERMERVCGSCPHFGACPGMFVANATPVERRLLEEGGCPVRATLDHMLDVFQNTELKDVIRKSQAGAGRAEAHAARSVG